MDIRYLLSDLIECKGNLQEWINRRYKNPDILQIDLNACDVIPYVMNKKGIIFKLSKNFNTLIEADLDYNYDDLGRDDICIDIGANIGGFAIPASYLCNKVFAVEPITFEELKQNISLNNRNIEVIQKGLGDGSDIIISWGKIRKEIATLSFTEIKEYCGGCDFLKCDCEGAEWFIKPDELNGVRRIEMEIHPMNLSTNPPENLLDYISSHYYVSIQENPAWEFIKSPMAEKHREVKILHAIRK